jgi:hypothetical protein
MPGCRQTVYGMFAASALACGAVTPACAGGHAFGPLHPWALGHGLFGAVAGLATLPFALASAVLSAGESDGSAGYGEGPARGYAPPPAYYPAPTYPGGAYAGRAYPAPQPYHVPARYYPPAPVYYPAPRAYYAPGAYYAPRAGFHGSYAGYGGHGAYRSGGYGYPHR